MKSTTCRPISISNGQLLLAGKDGNSRALYNSYYKQFMPRLGLAWTPETLHRRLVVRAAYGITSFLEGTGVNLRLPLNPPFFFESNQNYDLTTGAASARIGFNDLPRIHGNAGGQHPYLGLRSAAAVHAAEERQPGISAFDEHGDQRRLRQPEGNPHDRCP